MAIDIYSLPAVAHGRASVEKYRAKIESGIGQAQTLAEIGGSSYLTARLSAHLGGPEGKSFLGVPLELAVGAAWVYRKEAGLDGMIGFWETR